MPKSLVEAMKCLTEVRFGPNSLEQVCHLLVTLTCEVMPAPSAAAIALGPASPSDLTITPITACPLDSRSWDCGDGPIGDAATTVSQVHAHGDLSSWPAFAKRADRLRGHGRHRNSGRSEQQQARLLKRIRTRRQIRG